VLFRSERLYPVVSVTFPPSCCPSPSFSQNKQQIAVKLPPAPVVHKQSIVCAPTSISIVPDASVKRTQSQLSFDSVTPAQVQHLLHMSEFEAVTFAELLSATLMPMDGRITENVLTTPGGVVAEFAAALGAVESAVPGGLSDFDVTALLVGFAPEMPTPMFSYILDSPIITQIVGNLEHIDRREWEQIQLLPESQRQKAMLDLISRCPPSADVAESLLETLTAPPSITDSFLSFVLAFEPSPHASPESARAISRFQKLTTLVIKAFFRVLWNIPVRWLPNDNSEMLHLDPSMVYLSQSRMDLIALEGLHEESGVVRVLQASPKCKHTVAPVFASAVLLQPQSTVASLWLYQEDAPRLFRDAAVSYLRKRVGASRALSQSNSVGRVGDMISYFTRHFFNSVITNIPAYTATLDSSCCPHHHRD